MRIGIVLPALPAYSETFFQSKIQGLVANGHEVIVFIPATRSVNNYNGVKVRLGFPTRGSRIKLSLFAIWALLQLVTLHRKSFTQYLKIEKNDGTSILSAVKKSIIQSSLLKTKLDWLHFGFGTMALGRENVAEAIGAQMAVSFRGFDYYVYPVKHPKCYDKLYSKKVRYHVLSQSMKRGLIQEGIPEVTIHVISPAIATDFFICENPQTPKPYLQLLTVGRLHWIKGLDYIFEALALFKQQKIRFQFTLIGEGLEEERLRFTAHQLDIADCVTFAGKQNREAIKRQLEQTDVYIQYSLQEGFCNAVLEAQAMGVYCIVSDAEGLSENVIDGITGSVVIKRTPIRLLEALTNFTQLSEEERLRVKKVSVARIQSEYMLQKQQSLFLKFYHD